MASTRFRQLGIAICLLMGGGSAFAATNSLGVSGTVISKHNCVFKGNTSTLAFGAIDPLNNSNATATSTVSFVCHGNGSKPVAYVVTHDSGQQDTLAAPTPKMIRQTAPFDLLPYNLSLSPVNGTTPTNTQIDITVTGTILTNDFQNARPGNYQDTVIITVSP